MHHWKAEHNCRSMDIDNPTIAGSTVNHPCRWKKTDKKHTKLISNNAKESIRNPTHLDDAMKEKNARVCESCIASNFLVKYVVALFDRMVAMPLRDSFIIAKMGDRATPSRRFSSRELVTKTPRTTTK
mmetsp:Transcript_26601/g.73183  ORF Transcript_26601/g.73183 Transcript_26601/m.73183 type:complete len:128 (-) Transcript_26601:3632-4015(-)